MTRKESLLNAAKELFAELGYEGTTFKKISDRAGVALGLLTHHYGSKENLFFVAGIDVLEHLYGYVKERSADGPDGLERVMRFCRAYLDFSLEPDSRYILLLRCMPYSILKKETHDTLDQKFDRIFNCLNEQIEAGKQDGSVSCSLPPFTARVLCHTLIGVCRARLLMPSCPPALYEDTLELIRHSLVSARSG